jgi:hypothetical protein
MLRPTRPICFITHAKRETDAEGIDESALRAGQAEACLPHALALARPTNRRSRESSGPP